MNNVGNLRGKRVHHLSLEWDIDNYFTRRTTSYTCYESPQFIFGGCAWRLLLYPNDDPFSGTLGNAGLYLERLETFIKTHVVSYTIGIRNKDGKAYKSKKCTCSFQNTNTTFGYSDIDAKTNISNAGSELARDGVLTVFIEDFVLHKIIMDNDGGEQPVSPTGDEHNINDDGKKNCTQKDDDKNYDADDDDDDDDDDANDDSDAESDDDTDSNEEGTDILIKNFKDLFLNEEDCDVTFKVEDRELHAHRAILVARSPVFASMFRHDMSEKNTGNVNIPDCGAEAFKELLLYLYSGTVEYKSSVITFDLYEASIKYDLEHLKKKCVKFMKNDMSDETFCDILSIALKHTEMELINCATDFFAMHMKRILPTVKWQTFLKDNHIAANELIIKAMEKNYFF